MDIIGLSDGPIQIRRYYMQLTNFIIIYYIAKHPRQFEGPLVEESLM